MFSSVLFLLSIISIVSIVADKTNVADVNLPALNEIDEHMRANLLNCAMSCAREPFTSCGCMEEHGTPNKLKCSILYYGCNLACSENKLTGNDLKNCQNKCDADLTRCNEQPDNLEISPEMMHFDDTPSNSGACHNSQDIQSLSDLQSLKPSSISKMCSLKCLKHSDECKTRCIQSSLRVSQPCAGCFTVAEGCTKGCRENACDRLEEDQKSCQDCQDSCGWSGLPSCYENCAQGDCLQYDRDRKACEDCSASCSQLGNNCVGFDLL